MEFPEEIRLSPRTICGLACLRTGCIIQKNVLGWSCFFERYLCRRCLPLFLETEQQKYGHSDDDKNIRNVENTCPQRTDAEIHKVDRSSLIK